MISRPLTLPPVRPLLTLAAQIWDTTEKDIIGHSRRYEHARPRQAICYLTVASGRPKSEVARILKRDRTTVSHAAQRAEFLRETDGDFAIKLNQFERLVREAAQC